MFEVVLTVLFALHLICVNVAGGGPLVWIAVQWMGAPGEELQRQVGRRLLWWSLAGLVIGSALGLALAAAGWSSAQTEEVLQRFPDRIYWGIWELVFSAALLILCLVWSPRAAPARGERAAQTALAALAATNLLYHFPPLFVMMTMAAYDTLPTEAVIDSAQFRQLFVEPEVLAQAAHFWLASLAVAAKALMACCLSSYSRHQAPSQETDPQSPQPVIRGLVVGGARLALGATLAQIPVGIWLLTSLPRVTQSRFLGGDWTVTALFALAVMAAIYLMHQLAEVALGNAQRKAVIRALLMMALTVLLMCAALRQSRPQSSSTKGLTSQLTSSLARRHGAFGLRGALRDPPGFYGPAINDSLGRLLHAG